MREMKVAALQKKDISRVHGFCKFPQIFYCCRIWHNNSSKKKQTSRSCNCHSLQYVNDSVILQSYLNKFTHNGLYIILKNLQKHVSISFCRLTMLKTSINNLSLSLSFSLSYLYTRSREYIFLSLMTKQVVPPCYVERSLNHVNVQENRY